MKINLNADQTIVETVVKEGETDAEYDEFLTILANHPAPVEGKRAVLRYPSYEWDLIDDDTPDEPEADEAWDIEQGEYIPAGRIITVKGTMYECIKAHYAAWSKQPPNDEYWKEVTP